MSLEDVSDGYRTVLQMVVKTVNQTQTLLPENQPSAAAEIPAIRKTVSKSPNLEFLRKSLETLLVDDAKALEKASEELENQNDSPESAQAFQDDYDMARQRQLEEGVYASALEVWKFEMKEAMKRGDVYYTRLGMQGLAWDWVQAMKPVLEKHIEDIRPKYLNSDGQEIVPSIEKDTPNAKLDHIWLSALPLETMCAITVIELIRALTNESRTMGNRATALIQTIGRAVEHEMQAADLVRKENKGLHPKHINVRQVLQNRRTAETYSKAFRQELLKSQNGATHWPFEWRLDVRARVHPLDPLN
jgi:DNA-directed RNA polymerase